MMNIFLHARPSRLLACLLAAFFAWGLNSSPLLADENVTPATLQADTPDVSQAMHTPPAKVHVFSLDYPRKKYFHSLRTDTVEAADETRFYQYLDQAVHSLERLTLTPSSDGADYRVFIRCSGALGCSSLRVFVKDSDNNQLVSYSLPTKGGEAYLAFRLMETLDERIAGLKEGGYGELGTNP